MTLGSTSCESDFGDCNSIQHQNTGKQQKQPKEKYSKELPWRYQTSVKKADYRQRHWCYCEKILRNAVCHPASVLSLCYHAGCGEWCTALINPRFCCVIWRISNHLATSATMLFRWSVGFSAVCTTEYGVVFRITFIRYCRHLGIEGADLEQSLERYRNLNPCTHAVQHDNVAMRPLFGFLVIILVNLA